MPALSWRWVAERRRCSFAALRPLLLLFCGFIVRCAAQKPEGERVRERERWWSMGTEGEEMDQVEDGPRSNSHVVVATTIWVGNVHFALFLSHKQKRKHTLCARILTLARLRS